MENPTPQSTEENNKQLPSNRIFDTSRSSSRTLNFLKTPLSWGLSFLAFAFILRELATLATSEICAVPGATYIFSMCSEPKFLLPISMFQPLVEIQTGLSEIQEKAAGGVLLPLFMQNGEAVIQEVKIMVKFSEVPSQKDLVRNISEFLELSRSARNRLRTLNFQIDSTMDRIIFVNLHTKRRLQDLEQSEWQHRKGVLEKRPALLKEREFSNASETAAREQYATHLQNVKEVVEALIFEAQLTLLDLEAVEEGLSLIQDIVTHELLEVKDNNRTQFRQIAAYLGLRSTEIHKLEKQSIALNELREHGKTACVYVNGTLQGLLKINEDLEHLGEALNIPVQATDVVIRLPLGLQIEIVSRGLRRLEQGKNTSKQVKDRKKRENDA